MKIKSWKYCSKIIFKYVNSVVGLIFNEKVDKKMKFVGPWTVHGCTVHRRLVKSCGYFSCTVTTVGVKCVLQKKKKKKKSRKTQQLKCSKQNAVSKLPLRKIVAGASDSQSGLTLKSQVSPHFTASSPMFIFMFEYWRLLGVLLACCFERKR